MHFPTAFTLALPAIALATAIPHDGGNCNTGSIQCCNKVQEASSLSPGFLKGLVGVDVGSITGLIGSDCTPISALVGVGGNSCSSQPVCCSNNNFSGAVAIGCTPININL